MKRTTLVSLFNYLNGETITNLDEIKAELETELNKGAVAKAAANAAYDAAWEIVRSVLAMTTAPLTVAEIVEEAESRLPDGFGKGRVLYGLNHQWADQVVKIEGKPNTYRLA